MKPRPSPVKQAMGIGLGIFIVLMFIVSALNSDPETEPEPIDSYVREQTVAARSGVYSTRMVIESVEHQNESVNLTSTLIAPGIVSNLYGPDGAFRVTEVEFPAGEVPALETIGTERCAERGRNAVATTVRGTPSSTCHWDDGIIHDELMVVHANRVLLFEYGTLSGDTAPFTRMVDEIRLYPAKKPAE